MGTRRHDLKLISLCYRCCVGAAILGLITSPTDVTAGAPPHGMVFGPNQTDALTWWQTGIVYQVYPRSFKDTDGNGIGDLQGVVHKLDYLKDLGIEAVWLSPFYQSPMKDMGYDISDYRKVDPLFGNISAFNRLVSGAHTRGMKIIIDYVAGHTSIQHDWFQRSVRREAPYTDYYVWQDGKMVNGVRQPPNNWLSVFGGSAWQWNSQRRQYFYHAFLDSQANLNYRNAKVQEEMKNVIRFWFDRGVDGLRVDAISQLYQVANYSLDEPSAGNNLSSFNYNSQRHIYQEDRPEIIPTVTSWVQVLKEYERKDGKPRYMILETYANAETRTKLFATGGNPFNFELTWASRPITGYEIRDKILHEYTTLPPGKWPNFVLGNHDVTRVSVKFGSDHVDVFNMLLLTLWGTPTTYNGEEIGMIPPQISWEQTVDPWGRNYGKDHYKEFTRDYERSPMQWDNSKFAGFTTGNSTWLPVAKTYTTINVQAEQITPKRSTLKLYKQLARLRQQQAFKEGKLRVSVTSQNVFSYLRESNDTRYLVALNVGDKAERNVFAMDAKAFWGRLVAVTSNSSKKVNDIIPILLVPLDPGEGVVIQLFGGAHPLLGK